MDTRNAPEIDPARVERRARRLRRIKVEFIVLTIGALAFSAYFHRPLFRGNLGVVDEGRVYRSAQPLGDLPASIRSLGLASVVNLRGGDEADPWYVAEVEATRRAGVDFYDLPMSAVRRPTRRELLVLLDLLSRCKYPLLIHCKSGSDRTGLLAGLYLMAHKGIGPDRAEAAFSLAHGHVPLLGPERLHEPFDEYAAWLASTGRSHTSDLLLDWASRHYRDPSDDPPAPISPARPGPRVRRQAVRADGNRSPG